MDHTQQQQQQQLHDDHSQNYVPQGYPMYPEDDAYNTLVYPSQMPNYPGMPSGPPPRGSRLLSYISLHSHYI